MKVTEVDEYNADKTVTILSVDEVEKRILTEVSLPNGGKSTHGETFNGTGIAQYELTTRNFLGVHYTYDTSTNNIYMTSFSCGLIMHKFIEVDWSFFNKEFKGIFGDKNILDTVICSTSIKEITIKEFLSSISYTILGKKDIVDARNQFTNTRTSWTFEFDLKDAIYRFDNEENDYLPYNKYKVTLQFEYTNGGTIRRYQYIREYEYETSKLKREFYHEVNEWFGGEKLSLIRGFIIIGSSIAVCVVVTIAISIWRKKQGK